MKAKPMEQPSVAIDLGYYRMTAFDMADAIRKRIDALPKCAFAEIQVGKTYLYQHPYQGIGGGTREEVMLPVKLTPTRKQAVVRHRRDGSFQGDMRVYASGYSGTFREMDATLIALLGVMHADAVAEAVALGLEVPPRVRCEHPEMFLDIPDRFAKPHEWNGETAAERVKSTLKRDWGNSWPKKPVTAEAVDLWIGEAHRQLAHTRNETVRRIAENRAVAEDYDEVLKEFGDLVDFYRWLRPHVSPGGVFYVEE